MLSRKTLLLVTLSLVGCGGTQYRNPLDTTPLAPYEQAEGLRIGSQPKSGAVNAILAPVQVQFINGSRVVPVVGSITLALNPNPTHATLGGSLTLSSNDSGTATFSDLTINKKGNYRIQASSAVVNPIATDPIRIGNNSLVLSQITSLGNTAALLSGPAQVRSGDLNGDGFLDLVATYPNNTTPSQPLITSFLGDGTGQFTRSQNVSPAAGSRPGRFVLVDLNRDSKLDLAVCQANSQVGIYFGAGDGTFSASTPLSLPSTPNDILSADLNLDGLPDLVVSNSNSQILSIFLGSAGGGVNPPSTLSLANNGQPTCLGAADLNNDGRSDIVAGDSSNQVVQVFLNPSGGFQPPVSYSLNGGLNPSSLAFNDLNGDGRVDLVCSNLNTNNLCVFSNTGSGILSTATLLNTGGGPSCVAASDLTNDGKVDLINVNTLDDTLTFRSGIGDGTFNPPAAPIATSGGAQCLDLGDYNSDTLLDLSVACVTANRLNLFLQVP